MIEWKTTSGAFLSYQLCKTYFSIFLCDAQKKSETDSVVSRNSKTLSIFFSSLVLTSLAVKDGNIWAWIPFWEEQAWENDENLKRVSLWYKESCFVCKINGSSSSLNGGRLYFISNDVLQQAKKNLNHLDLMYAICNLFRVNWTEF